jgi:hypothetical protein
MHTKTHGKPHVGINTHVIVSVKLVLLHLQLLGRKKKQATEMPSSVEKPEKEIKIKITPIEKYELSDGKLTFSALSGLLKKRWVKVGEFPLSEITHVEGSGNLISITRDGALYRYVHKIKSESLKGLQEQILAYLSETQTTAENNRKTGVLKTDLAGALTATIPTVDLCFDILKGLNQKRINWSQIDSAASKLAGNVSFSGQTLAFLNVDLSMIPLSVKSQVPKDVVNDIMNVLKVVYGYFDALTPLDNLVENASNVDNAKRAILAYYIINDILLARVTSQKDDSEELLALETVVLDLVAKSNIKVRLDELNMALGNSKRGELGVDDVRAIFRAQLKQF